MDGPALNALLEALDKAIRADAYWTNADWATTQEEVQEAARNAEVARETARRIKSEIIIAVVLTGGHDNGISE